MARFLNSKENAFEIVNRGYGKSFVKFLHIEREGKKHTIREYEVNTTLKLATQKDYLQGDNSDVIATDSQKNTVYLMAKKFGVSTPEEFGILLCEHYLNHYKGHVVRVEVFVLVSHPWSRLANGRHNHAFVSSGACQRFAQVIQTEEDRQPKVTSGFKDLLILKTTQSSFLDFVNDEYRTLPDEPDRLFSSNVEASWDYLEVRRGIYDAIFRKVLDILFENFAGDPLDGIHSKSVQETLYKTEKQALSEIPEIGEMRMKMPNKHYFSVDLSKFPPEIGGCSANKEVFLPVDKPSGVIEATLARRHMQSKL